MKAIRFMDPGVIEYSEIPQPEIRDDEVLAQIAYAGFCATDIELLTGEMIHIKNGNTKYPIIPGHEWSGTVVAVGKNVRDFKVGDRVTSDVSLGCGECENCRQGHYNLCPNREVVGSYRNRHVRGHQGADSRRRPGAGDWRWSHWPAGGTACQYCGCQPGHHGRQLG